MKRSVPFAARAVWSIADQALSSLTNFALNILVARDFSTADLGIFGLVFTSYLVALNLARTLSIEPLLIRFSRVERDRWAAATAATTSLSLLIGVLGGIACLAVWLVVGGTIGACFLALGITLPGLLVQDAWRFAFFADGRGRSAALNDFTWALVLLPTLVLLVGASAATMPLLVAGWGFAATVAAAVGVRQSHVWPDPRLARAWLHDHRDLNRPLAAESMIGLSGSQLTNFSIAALGGLAAVGTLRAAQLLLGPLLVLYQGMQLIAVPEGSRLNARSPEALWRGCVAYATVLALIVLAGGLFVYFMPASIGTAILRQNWTPAHSVILPITCAFAVTWSASVGSVGLRVLAEGRRILRIGIVASVTTLVTATLGALMAGAFGGAIGIALGGFVGLALAWTNLRTVIQARLQTPTGPAASRRGPGGAGDASPAMG